MLEYYFLMVWSHYISLDVITLLNLRGVFILVWSSDSLAVSPGLSKTPGKATQVGNEPFCRAPSLRTPSTHVDVFASQGTGGGAFWEEFCFFFFS